MVLSPAGAWDFVPGRDAEGERLDFLGGDGFGQAHQQRARADAVDLLAGDGVRLNGHGEVEAEFSAATRTGCRIPCGRF
jgi:hypothetical protein